MRRLPVVELQSEVLRWARVRAGLEPEVLARKLSVKPERVGEWELSGKITMGQARKLARHTHTPLGYLYLPEPPVERLPIPDLRTVGDRPRQDCSPNLLDTVFLMQRRQAWMRDEMIEEGQSPLSLVASVRLATPPGQVAAAMRKMLGLPARWAEEESSWVHALRRLRSCIEDARVLVFSNGVVGNNTHRKLDPEEFRGFALADEYAPLIFINGADFKAAQMFTLIHELAHIWLGEGGVSNADVLAPDSHRVEQFCNLVAAEFLVPEAELIEEWPRDYQFLARRFKVSRMVVARRALDLELIGRREFFDFYRAWQEEERREQPHRQGGGNFWNNQNVRIGRRFGISVIRAAKEGRLLYRDAYALTGIKGKSFDNLAHQWGIDL